MLTIFSVDAERTDVSEQKGSNRRVSALSQQATEDATQGTETPTKRGRGRPRKPSGVSTTSVEPPESLGQDF